MGVSSRHILEQGPVLAALGAGAVSMIRQRRGGVATVMPTLPGPELRETINPRSKQLIRDYIRHVGGDASSHRGKLPPHMFPQWAFPILGRTLEGIPYPLARVLNGGCRLEMNAPLPADRALSLTARLESIDDDGSRAVMHQKVITSSSADPEALVAHMYAIVPLKRGAGRKKERARVPEHARELRYFRLPRGAGLDFAKLTGDFNPIHWVPAAARAAGFRNVILHGFSTMARAYEAVVRALLSGDAERLTVLDVKFTRPLVLPASVGVFVDGERELYVGDAPGGPAYLTGRFETKENIHE